MQLLFRIVYLQFRVVFFGPIVTNGLAERFLKKNIWASSLGYKNIETTDPKELKISHDSMLRGEAWSLSISQRGNCLPIWTG